jgi:hypothetical protein
LQQEITGLPIQVFEVNVMNSTGANVAEGKTATQSSTFRTTSGRSFDAYLAIDGDHDTFSHTNDANPWFEIDLGKSGEISSVEILNRWCKDTSDHPSGCLCRLSGAVLSLIDNLGEQITSLNIGNTCGQSTLEYVFEPSPDFCPTSSVSFLSHHFEHINFVLFFLQHFLICTPSIIIVSARCVSFKTVEPSLARKSVGQETNKLLDDELAYMFRHENDMRLTLIRI